MNDEYICPVCQQQLEIKNGTQLDPLDGITMGCPNKDCPNTAIGHGDNEKQAFAIIKEKCNKSLK
jgi:hypothetical protein